MIFYKILYCFRVALQNFTRNLFINVVAITTIAVTLIVLISFLLIVMNLAKFYQAWGEHIQIIVYLQNNLSEQTTDNLKAKIQSFDEVASISFVSKDEALQILRGSLAGQDGLMEGLEENPLPSSLEIKVKKQFRSLEGIETLVRKIKKISFVDDIEYGQKWLERFSAFFGFLKVFSLTIGGVLFFATIFIISNTLKLIVYSRRAEIEIMKLVGATNLFIQLPFFIEAIIQGLLGSSVAIIFLLLVLKFMSNKLINTFHFYFGSGDLIFLNVPLMAGILLLGIVVGLVGSLFSVNTLKELKA